MTLDDLVPANLGFTEETPGKEVGNEVIMHGEIKNYIKTNTA